MHERLFFMLRCKIYLKFKVRQECLTYLFDEVEMEYYGEEKKLNYVYQISAEQWNRIRKVIINF